MSIIQSADERVASPTQNVSHRATLGSEGLDRTTIDRNYTRHLDQTGVRSASPDAETVVGGPTWLPTAAACFATIRHSAVALSREFLRLTEARSDSRGCDPHGTGNVP